MPATDQLAQALLQTVLVKSEVRGAVQAALAGLPLAPSLVLGGGKAGRVMAETASRSFSNCPGALAVPREHAGFAGGLELLPAGHPLPDAESTLAVLRQEQWLREVGGPCLFLLSGGASAMIGAPADGIPLARLRALYDFLLHAGIDIKGMNLIRRHVTRWGGGKFLRLAKRPVSTLIISDVINDDLQVIGSGPTAADPSTCQEAARLLEHLGGGFEDIVGWLRAAAEETIKPGDPLLEKSMTQIVLSNRTVVEAVAQSLDANIVPPQIGTIDDVAAYWAQILEGPPGVYIAGGEPTVHIPKGATGMGGRNQHLVAAIARRKPKGEWLFASIATDGVDGNSGHAGAWVDSMKAQRLGADEIDAAMASYDSAAWCGRHGLAFQTGPTGTNVADVQVAVVKKSAGSMAGTGDPR